MGGTGGDGVRERGIKYHPLPSQRRFHDSRAPVQGVFGADWSGKSQALCQEAMKLSLFESGADGADGGSDVSDAAGRDAAALIEILERNRIPHE